MKEHLTDKGLRGLRPNKGLKNAPKIAPYDVMDDTVRNYGVRVLPTGEVVHILYTRFPGSKAPTRRKIGRFGNPAQPGFQPETSLSEARDLAGEWLNQIRKGIDPSREAKRIAQEAIEAERMRNGNLFCNVLETYFQSKAHLRSLHAMEITMRRELKSWLDRPLQDVANKIEIEGLVTAIRKRGHDGQARVTNGLIKGFFAWCVKNDKLAVSPYAKIDTLTLVGVTPERDRVLDDGEIRALWRACNRVGYPIGDYVKMLLLTGVRRNEAAKASWDDFKLGELRWIVPAPRMKHTKPTKPARAHLVP